MAPKAEIERNLSREPETSRCFSVKAETTEYLSGDAEMIVFFGTKGAI